MMYISSVPYLVCQQKNLRGTGITLVIIIFSLTDSAGITSMQVQERKSLVHGETKTISCHILHGLTIHCWIVISSLQLSARTEQVSLPRIKNGDSFPLLQLPGTW